MLNHFFIYFCNFCIFLHFLHFFAFFLHFLQIGRCEQLLGYPKVIQSYPKVARKWITQKLLVLGPKKCKKMLVTTHFITFVDFSTLCFQQKMLHFFVEKLSSNIENGHFKNVQNRFQKKLLSKKMCKKMQNLFLCKIERLIYR